MPWPKLSCVVRYGVSAAISGSANVTVRCTGPVAARSGDQPLSLRGSRQPAGGNFASHDDRRGARDAFQLVQIHLVIGDGVRRDGDRREDESSLVGLIGSRLALARACPPDRCPSRRRGSSATG